MDPDSREREREEMERLARRIADGHLVDWEAEATETTSPDVVRHLKLVERISEAHRRLHENDLPFKSWGPLDLQRMTAGGTFGDVYVAHDRNLDRTVALKLLAEDGPSADREKFLSEARNLARVRHENVVTVHGVDVHEGRAGLWMEWIDGETLDALLDDRGPFSAAEAAQVGVEICRALAAIHRAGLLHRDVKLTNVMRERGGRIVLMDFGSSTRRAGERPRMGTPVYLAPEVFEGADSGPRTDVYSLGVLLYRLCSDGFPVEFGTYDEMRRRHRAGVRTPLSERAPALPPAFVAVVEKAIDPDPAKRFAGAAEMARALREVTGLPPASKGSGPRESRRWLAAGVAVIAIALLAAALLMRGVPFDARAELYRFSATGTEERLAPGSTVRPGDQLFVELNASRDSWVYILTADASGFHHVLFPDPALPVNNPLPSGTTPIPGEIDGVKNGWNVISAGGYDLILVVASTRPLLFVEERIAELRQQLPEGPLPIAGAELGERLRGIGGLSPVPFDSLSGATIVDEIAESVSRREGKSRGVRVWEWVLVNPE